MGIFSDALGPHQGIRLERLRAELDDKFERLEQPLSSIESNPYDQTQLVIDDGKHIPVIGTESITNGHPKQTQTAMIGWITKAKNGTE